MIIREALSNDMHQVLNLIKELATFEKEPNAVVITEEDLINDGFLQNPPLFFCYVAELNNEIIGMALCYYRYSTWKGKTIHLEDLIVKENMRGCGAGFALYEKVLKKAYEEKVRRVEWAVLDWNTSAIKFYERTGAKVLNDWRTVHIDEKGINYFINHILQQ